ncbi:efflux RND transporter periplasmic adaptor subunit [Adhaeribacter sp. BT258]|uniref:Efflux RND transporter periplasmic adaptor subunit n=1 Tax=Adhaeribacter terrigena TaxID=2793070 RepID=A0ABS1C210_9BACT|nr:efflux RND transporter periplasmic adaptor subunit [Adhaeribacter terrigena]MBK0403364.1 efflux RND transporter periplasmic adaptor subunit [Adhaeribacter terrigena]
MRIYQYSFLPLIICGLYACGPKEKPAQEKPQDETPTVKVTEVQSLQPNKPIVIPGELHPLNKVAIFAKVKGFVREVKVDRGSVVKKGQVLAILDAPETGADFAQAQGMVRAAEGALTEAKARAYASKQNYLRLLKANEIAGSVAPVELDKAEANMKADSAARVNAEGNLKAARSVFSSKAEMVNYLTITAPFSGTITERHISPGALVGGSGSEALFQLEDQSTLRLTIAIPEKYTNIVNRDTSVTFSVNAIPNKEFAAPFSRSSGSVDDKNRVMLTEFDVPNPTGELKAGMYAEVKLPLVRKEKTLFVPVSSVVNSDEKIFVIKTVGNKAQWVTIEKGMAIDTLVEVFGDVKQGDKVVLRASEELRDGEPIKVR